MITRGSKHDLVNWQFSLNLQRLLTPLNSFKGGIKMLIKIASYRQSRPRKFDSDDNYFKLKVGFVTFNSESKQLSLDELQCSLKLRKTFTHIFLLLNFDFKIAL